jgi:ABC-type bacteriocin/lantibiotic exporter with double-glycine peptidase domain
MKVNNINKIRKCSVLQHDSTDCGSACLVSVIRYFGGDSTVEKVRKLSGTSQSGTSMLGLYQAAMECGMDPTGFEASIGEIIEYDRILILHVTPEKGYEHYIVNYGFNDGKFIIWDPASGLKFLSREELNSIWISRKCLGIVPNTRFRRKEQDSRSKWKWLIENVRPEKDLLLVSVLIGIVISILGMVMALFTQKLIDQILPSGELSALLIATSLVFMLLSSRIIISAIRQNFLLSQGRSFNIRIVDRFYSSLLNLPRFFFDTRKTGDFVARLNDTTRVQRVIADVITVYIIDVLIVFITIIIFFYYSRAAAIISLICIPVIYFIVNRWNGKIISSQHSLMAGYALSESNFINSLKGITEIKSLNWQDPFSLRNKKIYSDFQDRAVNLGKIKIRLGLITGLAGTLYLIIILLYSSMQVMKSDLTQGELMAIMTLSSTMLPSLLNLALVSIPLNEVKVALNRMFEFTRIEPEEKPGETPVRSILSIEQLKLEDISFRFPGQKTLLEKISLTIEKGKVISLVGECGSGKSTLANIILRYYQAESGRIMVNDGFGSEAIDLKTWRSRIGIIPQEVHIFNGTILQNLITEISESRINDTISKILEYGLGQFINSFPLGLMTLVGEEGINLSGGQKQLLAFIRVLLNKPDILVIDEGTSNMDRNTEVMIMDLISRLKSGMGILLISHRINMIKKLSDKIYVLENKKIIMEGTHNELIGIDNLYNRFWKDFY